MSSTLVARQHKPQTVIGVEKTEGKALTTEKYI
jgi:hypothetical protein